MNSFEKFWLVGCVVSFICGLLTPSYSKEKKFKVIDFLYAIVCSCGSWFYTIIFIFAIVWRMVLKNIDKSKRETFNDKGLTYPQIINALRVNPFNQNIHSKYKIEFSEQPRGEIENIVKDVNVTSEKGWNYGNPTVHYTDIVAVMPIDSPLYPTEDMFTPIPYGEKIFVQTEHTQFDDFKFEYDDIHTASELECVKVVLAYDYRTKKSLYADNISMSINGYNVTLQNAFAASQVNNVVSFNYDLCDTIKEK